VPEGGSGELGNGGVGWHQNLGKVFSEGVGQCLQTQGHEPPADALARRASATQWAEAAPDRRALILRPAVMYGGFADIKYSIHQHFIKDC
jgi:hypothetical protein